MAKVNIGKCKIYHKTSTNGAPEASGDWTELPTPKEGTTTLSASEGTDVEAVIEGGEVIDSITASSTYTLEWEEWSEKGVAPSLDDVNGVVSGEHAFKVVPDRDEACPGFQIDRATVKAGLSYTTADGQRTKYTAKALKPASGNTVKRINMGASGGA